MKEVAICLLVVGLIIGSVILLALCFGPAPPEYRYKKGYTIRNPTDEELQNFSAYIRLDRLEGMQQDFSDVIFKDANLKPLNSTCTPNGDEGNCFVHVTLPASGNFSGYMCYGGKPERDKEGCRR
jgi:hypothetical protein